MGAALLAGVASGAFKNIKEAATLISASADYLPPDLCAGARLDQSYQRYRRLFSSLKSIFPQT
jgi:ribulose kinase